MKKTIFTLGIFLLGTASAMAHVRHNSSTHIHLTESISYGIASILSITFIITFILLIKKQFKKNKNHAL